VKVRHKALSIIAVLAFLMSLLPTLSVGAVAGSVALDEAAYTNLGGSNLILVTVDDDDMNIGKVGTARFAIGNNDVDDFDITASATVLEGEVDKTDTFTGVVLETGTVTTASTTALVDTAATFVTAGVAVGDVVTNTTDSLSAAVTVVTSETILQVALTLDATDTYSIGDATFTLADTARDADGDGTLDDDKDLTVKIGGTDKGSPTDYNYNFTTKVITFGPAAPAAAAAITVAYEISEYTTAAPTSSPIRLFGTTVKFGTTFALATNEKSIDIINNATGVITTNSNVLGSSTTNDFVVIEFVYDGVDDTDSGSTKTVNVKSTSDILGKNLTGTETGANTGEFEVEVALASDAIHDTLESQVGTGKPLADTALLSALITALAALDTDGPGDDAALWVTNTVGITSSTGNIGAIVAGDAIEDLLDFTVKADHSDVLTATYTDTGSTDTDTATIDAEGPVISDFTPADDTLTNDTTPLLSAMVVDADEGVTAANIVVDLDNSADVGASKDAITDGFNVQFLPGVQAEGAHDWKITATDALGNVSIKEADFTIDATDPTMDAVETGTGIKLATTDLDADGKLDDYQEYDTRTSIKVTFSEVLDEDTVAAGDFDVAGASAPDAVTMQDNIYNRAGTALTNDLRFVYMTVPELAPDATPDVDLSTAGTVSDAAGNIIATADITEVEANDKISPDITITLSATLGADEDEIDITVATDESLGDIEVTVTNEETNAVTTVTMGQVGTTNSWTGDFEIGDSTVYTVDVTLEDGNLNQATEDAEFEGDIDSSTVAIAAVGESGGEVEEGAVWVEFTFTEGSEYTDDSYTKVTATAATLTLDDDSEVDVLAELFPTGSAAKFTLARNLLPGDYTVEIAAEDSAGNAVTDDHEFEVVELAETVVALKPGMNLISLPGVPFDGAINTIIAAADPIDLVVYFNNETSSYQTSQRDAVTGLFTGSITTLDAGKAYWLRSSAAFDLGVVIPPQEFNVLPPSISLVTGYNAVGVWTISGDSTIDADSYFGSVDWTVAYTFDPTPGIGWVVIRPGDVDTVGSTKGYLVYVTAPGLLTP